MALFTPPGIYDGFRWRGMRVGLLGGSFNPPHEGHVHIAQTALRALNLDCVWWMVTPQNPLKAAKDTLPFERRFALCRALTRHDPRMVISDLDQRCNNIYSITMLQNMRTMFPLTRFVFIAGTDVLEHLPKWYCWRDLHKESSLAFVERPPALSLVRQHGLHLPGLKNHHLSARGANPPLKPGDCYWISGHRLHPQSSTKIRNII